MGCTLSRNNGCQPFPFPRDDRRSCVKSTADGVFDDAEACNNRNGEQNTVPSMQLGAGTPILGADDDHPTTPRTPRDGYPLNTSYSTPLASVHNSPKDLVSLKKAAEGDIGSFGTEDSSGEHEEPGSPGQSIEVGDALFVVDACGHRVRRCENEPCSI